MNNLSVTGIAYWASLQSPNKASGKYCIDLVVDKKTEEELLKLGLRPAKRESGDLVMYEDHPGMVFRFTQKTETKDGRKLDPPIVTDAKANLTDVLIGNGSKVNVAVRPYIAQTPSGPRQCAGLRGVQIIDLIEYHVDRSSIAKGMFEATSGFDSTEMETDADSDLGGDLSSQKVDF